MFQNVSDESISASESASFIIAQMKAFGIEASNAEHIIDAVNAVSNSYAVSSGQLAKNLGNMSAALSVGNNSFEESLGLLTSGVEVTRNASKVSRALVSVQSRLNQVIDESSTTGQALTEWYQEHNIAILDQQGQLRSLYDVLTDVAEIWPKLTKNEQAYYLNQQAGANQSQNLAAILSNFDTAAKATATAINSAGSAMKENEAYAESLDFQTNALKADFQDLANNVIDKQLISALLTLGDAFLKVADTGVGTFITKVGLLAGTGWGLSSLLKVTNVIPVIASQFSNLATVIGMIGNPAVVSSIGGIGTALASVGGFAGIALPALLGISTVLVGIVELANALEENAHKAEKELQDLQTQISEMEDPSSEYSNLKSRVDELTESEKIRLGVLQSQLDNLKEQEEVLSRQQLAKWQKGQVEDQTTYTTTYDDYGYGVTEAYTYNQAADSLKNLREEYYNLQKEKEQGAVSDTAYISRLQSIIDKNQDTTTNLRALKAAYEETGDATYKLNSDQERFLRLIDATSTLLADNATKVANAVQDEQNAANGLEDALGQIEVATYDTSTATAQLVSSLFDANGNLTTTAKTTLQGSAAMREMATAELQAQQAAAQANFNNLIKQINAVGTAAMMSAQQLSTMMALAGSGMGSATDAQLSGLKRTYQLKFGKSAESDVEAFNKWVASTTMQTAANEFDRIQAKLDKIQSLGTGGGGGSSGKSAEEKAAEEAKKQAKKAQQAQEKAAKESQQVYESAAKSAEQAAQQAAQAAEQAAEEAKQKILDSIQELKDASDDFWDERTDTIEESNKELDRQKQLEEKLKALEEARQKEILLYKNGQFQYDKDYGTIAKAQADYEETRDKIHREKELEQLKEMKDNATEIFNEMKDIVQNGGDVTQTMIDNWLKQMQADGANYYDSNKAILSEWLTWAQGAIKEFSQSALDAIGSYTSTSSIMSSGAYGSSSTTDGDINWNRYMTDSTFWKDGEFVGLSTAFWIDRFEKQIKSGFEPENWLGGGKGTSVFDDWQEVFDYWAEYQGNELSGKMADVEAVKDMIERAKAAQIVLAKYKDTFISLGYDEYAQLAERAEKMDIAKMAKTARIKGAMAHPEDPFGLRGISAADYTTVEGKLYNLLSDIGFYEYLTGSRTAVGESKEGKDYERLTIAGDLARTANLSDWRKATQKLFTDAMGDYYPDVRGVAFDEDKLKRFYEDNEAAIKQLQEMWFEARTDTEKEAIHLEAEARRQARDYTEEILGMSPSGRSEAERQANLAGGTYLDTKRNKVIDNNVEKIKEHLEDAENGTAITQRYINNAKDYIGKIIEENSKKWFDTYDTTEKEKLHQQNEQLRVLQEQLEQGKYENLLPGGEKAGLTGWEQENQLEEFDVDAERLKQIRELREEMAENSKAWWDADEETRKKLHEANERLAGMIGDLSDMQVSYEGHTGTWTFDNTPRNATGTRNFRGGLSLVGERGPEMRILGQGDNIIPANQTANLWKWSNVTPQQMLTTLSARQGGGNTSYAFDVSRIELPNVTDAKSFVQGLKNYALQYSYKR